MGEIGGAVERIDIPAIVAAGVDETLLFAKDVVAGKLTSDPLPDERLRLAVGGRHQIGFSLVLDVYIAAEKPHEQRARLAGDLSHGRNKPAPITSTHAVRFPGVSAMYMISCL